MRIFIMVFFLLSCNDGKEKDAIILSQANYFKVIGKNDIPLGIPKKGEWLFDTANFKLCLSRLVSVSSHELGHMLTMQHCTFAKCVMNGSNSLHESDLSPNRLCSECQKKLYWNFKYDNKQRLKQLYDFCRKNALQRDFDILKLDWQAIKQ